MILQLPRNGCGHVRRKVLDRLLGLREGPDGRLECGSSRASWRKDDSPSSRWREMAGERCAPWASITIYRTILSPHEIEYHNISYLIEWAPKSCIDLQKPFEATSQSSPKLIDLRPQALHRSSQQIHQESHSKGRPNPLGERKEGRCMAHGACMRHG